MITIKKYTTKDVVVWDAFVDASKNGTFMLKRGYMDYHADRFEDHSLMFYDDDELVALLPASLHGMELRSHGGLTYGGVISCCTMKQHTMNECFVSLKNYLLSNNIKQLSYKAIPYIYHRYPCQEDLYALWHNGAHLIRRDVSTIIDLSVPPIKLPKGRKAQIARAKREGIIVELSSDFEKFIELENSVLTQYHQTVAVHTGAELTLLHSRFPDNIRLLIATHHQEMIAGVVLFIYDNLVHTQYMANSEYGRANGGLDLIISTIMEEYKSDKKYLDFGISTEEAGKVINHGLISQKESFGGRSIVYDFYELMI